MNFDKEKFSEILEKIISQYKGISDFCEIAEINRGHISKYLNQRFDNPPKPRLLTIIAENAKGVTTYAELMQICGYTEMTDEYNLLVSGNIEYANLYFRGQNKNKKEQIDTLTKMLNNLEAYCNEMEERRSTLNQEHNILNDYHINNLKFEIERTKKEVEGLKKIIQQLKDRK